MTEFQYKQRIAKQILALNIIFAVVLLFFYVSGGFDSDEIVKIAQMLAPIHLMYFSAVMNYIISNPYKPEADKSQELTGLFFRTSTWFIWLHIIGLLLVFALKAFNILAMDMVMNVAFGIETFFGAYIGNFLTKLFKKEEEASA